MAQFRVAVVGGGVLGCAIAYFLSSTLSAGSVALIEQEAGVGFHASSRNTGKVHAPFLYDPVKKRLFARAAYLGFEMWQAYAEKRGFPFKSDGVLEVATDDRGVARLHLYLKWGEANGLRPEELRLLDRAEVRRLEPSVTCLGGLFCSRDASVDYGSLTRSLAADCREKGVSLILGGRVASVSSDPSGLQLTLSDGRRLGAEFLVNAAGGGSLAVARLMGLATDLSAIYFRGEYWKAPSQYRSLTRSSVYSVPRHPEYPFLDPHWIVRTNGEVDVGPNAVPVTGPEAYDWNSTVRTLPHFAKEMIEHSVLRVFLDAEFLSLAAAEWRSSLSKEAMIGRIREFLPQIDPAAFHQHGFAGIRGVVVNRYGRFLEDALILRGENSLHVLNYNSPGATGALPMGAKIAKEVLERIRFSPTRARSGLWDLEEVAGRMDS